MNDYITTQECANKLGVTPQRIWQKIKRGEIKAVRFSRLWMIPRTELDGWSRVKVKNKEWLFKKSTITSAK